MNASTRSTIWLALAVIAGLSAGIAIACFTRGGVPAPGIERNATDGIVGVGDHHADNMIIVDQADSFDSRGIPTHRAGIRFTEADGHALSCDQHDFVAGANHRSVYKFVTFT